MIAAPEDEDEVVFVKFRAPRALYEEFVAAFPWHGSSQWFFTVALRTFMEEVKTHPSYVEMMRNGFDAYREQQRQTRGESAAAR